MDETKINTFYTKMIDVSAMSKEHAKRLAVSYGIPMDTIVDVYTVRNPRNASTCKTDDYPTRGTRKWKTVYQVHAYGAKIAMGLDKFEYLNMELVRDDIETKTEAVKIAKEMAIKHQLPMTVQVVQKSISHTPTCADIEPKTTLGTFQVKYVEI